MLFAPLSTFENTFFWAVAAPFEKYDELRDITFGPWGEVREELNREFHFTEVIGLVVAAVSDFSWLDLLIWLKVIIWLLRDYPIMII